MISIITQQSNIRNFVYWNSRTTGSPGPWHIESSLPFVSRTKRRITKPIEQRFEAAAMSSSPPPLLLHHHLVVLQVRVTRRRHCKQWLRLRQMMNPKWIIRTAGKLNRSSSSGSSSDSDETIQMLISWPIKHYERVSIFKDGKAKVSTEGDWKSAARNQMSSLHPSHCWPTTVWQYAKSSCWDGHIILQKSISLSLRFSQGRTSWTAKTGSGKT